MARLQNIFSCELTWLSVSTISNRNWSLHIPTQIISIYLVKEPGERFRFVLLSRCILQHFKSLSTLFFRRLSKREETNNPYQSPQSHSARPDKNTNHRTRSKLTNFLSTPKSRPFYINYQTRQVLIAALANFMLQTCRHRSIKRFDSSK